MTRVGFTGTRRGMDEAQKRALRETLVAVRATELHHGDCVGADAEADAIARRLGIEVVIHPPTDPRRRAFCARPGDVVWQPLPYLERNRDIVDSASLVVAAPYVDVEQVRSGTWATVRYAMRLRRKVVFLTRDRATPEGAPPPDQRGASPSDSLEQTIGGPQ